MVRLNLFDLFAKISLDTSDYDSGVKNVSKSGSSLASKLKSGLATAGKAAAAGIAAIGTAAVAGIAALNGIAEATEEYRVAMGKLNTAFDAAGFSADAAQEAYSGFYAILGDTDTATEASQLLAKLAESEEDVSTWTNIAAGVFGTFGDSLPIEGLIEASNETAKVGQVTGVLADALNWAGISEDAFNEQLAACSSESERNRLIMETLAGTYDDAADSFYENNAALIQSRENQERLNKVLAGIGTAVENAKNAMLSTFLPAIEEAGGKVEEFVTRLSNAFSEDGLSGLLSAGSEIIVELVSGIVSGLPQIISSAVQIIQTILEGIRQNLPVITQGAVEALTAFVNGLVELLPDLLQTGIELIVNLANGIAQALPELIPVAVEAILQFAETLIDNIDMIVDAAVNLVTALSDGIVDAIPILVEKAPEIVAQLAWGIIRNIPKIIAAAGEIIYELTMALGDGFESLYNNAIQWVDDNIIQPIRNKIQEFIDIGSDIVNGIKQGISNAWGSFMTWVKDKIDNSFVGGILDLLEIHSPSKVFMGIGEYIVQGLAVGMENSSGTVMETVADIVDEIKSRFNGIYDALTARQDVGDLQYELWERTEGRNATEAEKYEKQLELLNAQQKDQRGIVEAAAAAYEAVVEQYGESSAESYEYQKTLLEEKLAYQDLIDEIQEVIKARQELYSTSAGTVSFSDSALAQTSAATVNALSSSPANESISLTANMMLPDGTKFATWQLPYLIQAGRAAGTPIANPQVG